MSISNPVGAPYDERAADLVARVDQDQWGSVGPSLYETARVLSAAPWLPGEPRRITYLLEQQAPDGSWGDGPPHYRLLPTLSAVEAALAVLRRGAASAEVTGRLHGRGGQGPRRVAVAAPGGPLAGHRSGGDTRARPGGRDQREAGLMRPPTAGTCRAPAAPGSRSRAAFTGRHRPAWPGGTSRRAACPSSTTTRSKA